MCGHYTQLVWKKTTAVGCGMAVCGSRDQIWVCQYSPAGNWAGQKPY
ncbi:MAG: CAP domain-containing protein [Sulfurimicrobium sp.]|nr:CAP domain-containing protein [Sulfurimicrobium sp.]